MTFDDKIDCENYYDNCMYNCGGARQVLMFETYNLTKKLGMIYIEITKYFNFLLSG